MNTAAIYTRLSLADENSTSTSRQKKECEDHAKSLGLEVVKVFNDEGISGFKDVERPEFDEAIEALVRGEFDTLIVWKLDRLSRRGMGHIGTLLDRLDGSGRRIVSKMDGIDTSQSHGRIMVALLSEMARSESANTSLRLKAERHESREKGRISCGKVPWGLMRLDDGKIAPHPETGSIAREVVDRFLAGEKRMEIVRWLNESGHFTDRGNLWSEAALARWLNFPTLAGIYSHNPEKNRVPEPYRHSETGELVRVGEGIITEAEFWEIRTRLRPRRVKNGTYGRKSSKALSGLLKCGKCGSTMYGAKEDYYCSGSRKGICSANYVNREYVAAFVADAVISKVCAFDPGSEIHEKIEDVWRGDGSDHLPLGDSMKEETYLAELQGRRAKLLEDRYVKGRFDGQDEFFDDMLSNLDTMIENQSAKVEVLVPAKSRKRQMDLSDSEIVREAWENAPNQDRNAVLKTVVEKIVIAKGGARRTFRPERVEIHWHAA